MPPSLTFTKSCMSMLARPPAPDSRYCTFTLLLWRRCVLFFHFSNYQFKCLADILIMTCWSFSPSTIPFFGQSFPRRRVYLSTRRSEQVRRRATVAWINLTCFQRDILAPSPFPTHINLQIRGVKYRMIKDFVADDFDHFQGWFWSHGIHEQVSMYPNRMSWIQNTVFILLSQHTLRLRMGSDLSSSVNNLSGVFLAFVFYRLGKSVLDGRIIRFDEMIFHILHGEWRFP